ncbi:hypothetical protein OH76DRAFT_1459357 [Lentinus brumalis]|uniref:Transposase domain-containing protein n=1 Tax=Lentinus brumalis TaxID=2498619 RepID=A0A371CKM1_9APHY|nr:hypothetical protein OH76DRAFT_1459357 [Polyporus brumalis]
MPKRKNAESVYECNCDQFCGGVPTPVTAAAWKKHKPYRIGRVVDALKDVVGKMLGRAVSGSGSGSQAGRAKRQRGDEEYVDFVQNATLKSCGMDKESRDRLRNPPRGVPDLSEDPTLRLALRQFIANGHSEAAYEANRRACMEEHPERELPSLKSIKKTVEELTGIKPIVTDMCENSCLAYTGPHKNLKECPICPERAPRYDIHKGKNVPRRTFDTYPLGPQAQALMRNRECAERMHHRRKVTAELKAKLALGETWDVAEDIYYSKDFMDAVDDGIINPDDMLLMFSVDGAQLYESKASDCYIYIWVLFDMSPKLRYKKRYVLPGAIIPGPRKPQDLESFLLPGLMHISALQKTGLRIWDAADERMYITHPIIIFATADCVGMPYINGLVGHSGAQGCRFWCPMRSRHKRGTGYYYPAMLRPQNATQGCDAPDYSARDPLPDTRTTARRFKRALNYVLGSANLTEYRKRRLKTGIGKPSIFSGLTISVGIPKMFAGDVMHHLALNIPDIMVKLFRGSFECKKPDKVEDWPWAVFRPLSTPQGEDDSFWIEHGEAVGDMRFYIPRSFGRAPRNIAAKLNSGFKAWEHMYHFYMVLPGLLYGVLDDELFAHYCKLVAGCRFALMLETPVALRPLAHKLLTEFVEDFERLYYQRRLDRLHFCRHSIHLLLHLVPEGIRRGPLWLFSQWVLETFIGNLTCEIGTDSCPYANLAARATRRAQEAALYAIYPELAKPEGLPKNAMELGDDYVLLAYGRDECGRLLPQGGTEAAALMSFLETQDIAVPDAWEPGVWKWSRLLLPNGQTARTAWRECQREARDVPIRRARMVKLRGDVFAEVLYFFPLNIQPGDGHIETTRVLAMVSEFTRPDPTIAEKTHGVLMVCYSQVQAPPRVVDVKDIMSVVAMMPMGPRPFEADQPDAARLCANRYYVGEKLGCDMAWIGRADNPNDDDDDDDDD